MDESWKLWGFLDTKIVNKNVPDEFLTKNNVLQVNWQMGNVCTNNCSYCNDGSKDGTNPFPSYEQTENIIKKLNQVYTQEPYNKKYINFELLGGEITVWKDIDKFLEMAKSYEANVLNVLTNGSRSVRWWNSYGSLFDRVHITFHPEFANKEHIVEVGNALHKNGVNVSTMVLMQPSKWNKCIEFLDYAKQHSILPYINAAMLRQHTLDGWKPWPYTPEEIDWFKNNSETIPINATLKNKFIFNKSTFRKADTLEIITDDKLKKKKENSFKDWQCLAGIDHLSLRMNGDIHKTVMCYTGEPIGNWKSNNLNNISWPTKSVQCVYDWCFCSGDIRGRKFKQNETWSV